MPQTNQDLQGILTKSLVDGFYRSTDPNPLPPDSWVAGVAPTLASASGTFTEGASITLTGTNLSRKNQSQIFFTDFSADTIGQRAAGFTYWVSIPGDEYRVANAVTPPVGARYMSAHTVQSQFNTIHYEMPADSDEIFVESFIRLNAVTFHQPLWSVGTLYVSGNRVSYLHPTTSAIFNFVATAAAVNMAQAPLAPDGSLNSTFWTYLQQPQIKSLRVVDGTGETSAQGRPTFLSSIVETAPAGSQLQIGGVGDTRICYTVTPGNTVWAKHLFYAKLGTLNVADGKRYTKVNGASNILNSGFTGGGHYASPANTVTQAAFDGELMSTNVTANAGIKFRRVLPPYYNVDHQETISDVCHWFVNDSPERVVVSSSSTWAAVDQTKSHICPVTSRSNSQWTFKAYVGQFTSGPLYAYVFNRDGLYNANGIQVRA